MADDKRFKVSAPVAEAFEQGDGVAKVGGFTITVQEGEAPMWANVTVQFQVEHENQSEFVIEAIKDTLADYDIDEPAVTVVPIEGDHDAEWEPEP